MLANTFTSLVLLQNCILARNEKFDSNVAIVFIKKKCKNQLDVNSDV